MPFKEVAREVGVSPDNLVGLLVKYQKHTGKNFLTETDLKTISEETGITESELYSVATFYTLLSMEPKGKHIIQLCNDIPCYVNGSCNVKEELENLLGIKMGETTGDGLFTLEFTSCLGCCEIAPVIRVDNEIYGNLTGEKVAQIIAEYRGK